MNDTLIANICTVLSTMKADQKWTDAHDETYLVGLEDLPDEAGVVLRREILKRWDWRPSVKEIRDLWAKISAPALARSADEVVAEIYRLRDKYGEFAVSSPDFPGLRLAGEPTWTDDVKRRIVAAMGGWVAFCRDDAPASVQRGQLLKIAQMVLGNEGDGAIERLRLEYREEVAALSRPEPDPPVNLLPLEGGDEPGNLSRLGSLNLPVKNGNGARNGNGNR